MTAFSQILIKLVLHEINLINIKNLLFYIISRDWINAAPLKSVHYWFVIFVIDCLKKSTSLHLQILLSFLNVMLWLHEVGDIC